MDIIAAAVGPSRAIDLAALAGELACRGHEVLLVTPRELSSSIGSRLQRHVDSDAASRKGEEAPPDALSCHAPQLPCPASGWCRRHSTQALKHCSTAAQRMAT